MKILTIIVLQLNFGGGVYVAVSGGEGGGEGQGGELVKGLNGGVDGKTVGVGGDTGGAGNSIHPFIITAGGVGIMAVKNIIMERHVGKT